MSGNVWLVTIRFVLDDREQEWEIPVEQEDPKAATAVAMHAWRDYFGPDARQREVTFRLLGQQYA